MSPKRELCLQINSIFEIIGSWIDLKTSVSVGGLDLISQTIFLFKKPHILITMNKNEYLGEICYL